ncbi:unnamed protein product [Boreogadus saida]
MYEYNEFKPAMFSAVISALVRRRNISDLNLKHLIYSCFGLMLSLPCAHTHINNPLRTKCMMFNICMLENNQI